MAGQQDAGGVQPGARTVDERGFHGGRHRGGKGACTCPALNRVGAFFLRVRTVVAAAIMVRIHRVICTHRVTGVLLVGLIGNNAAPFDRHGLKVKDHCDN